MQEYAPYRKSFLSFVVTEKLLNMKNTHGKDGIGSNRVTFIFKMKAESESFHDGQLNNISGETFGHELNMNEKLPFWAMK